MKKGFLSEYFSGVAAKTLAPVEADLAVSRQHELNGVASLRAILGSARRLIPTRFMYLSDEEESVESEPGSLTWYDAREGDQRRSEYRLYFPTNRVSQCFAAGDLLVVALLRDGSALCITAAAQSTVANQVRWLFGLDPGESDEFLAIDETVTDSQELDYTSYLILDAIGVDTSSNTESYALLDSLLNQFGARFPSTKEFSEFARTAAQLDPRDGPDEVLMAWLSIEHTAFLALERHLIKDRLRKGFVVDKVVDVDSFLKFSLSVQNRRKARAGHALENHLSAVFDAYSIRYSRQEHTEGKNKPDFLFPGVECYRDKTFPERLLTVLAAKTTAKDRWRQILVEAERVKEKHLLTLEAAITAAQTNEMQVHGVTLVVPDEIYWTYTAEQQRSLMNIESFLTLVADRQSGAMGM